MDTATLTSPFLSARAVTRLLVAPTHTAQCQAAGLASVSAIRSAGRLVWTLLQISVRKLRKTFFLFKFIYLFKKKKKNLELMIGVIVSMVNVNGPPLGWGHMAK